MNLNRPLHESLLCEALIRRFHRVDGDLYSWSHWEAGYIRWMKEREKNVAVRNRAFWGLRNRLRRIREQSEERLGKVLELREIVRRKVDEDVAVFVTLEKESVEAGVREAYFEGEEGDVEPTDVKEGERSTANSNRSL